MHSFQKSLIRILVVATFGLTQSAIVTHAQLVGPTPYLKAADSPFQPANFSWFYLERFEENTNSPFHTLSYTPGWTASAGNLTTLFGYSGAIIDSVDEDDGSINNSSVNDNIASDSWFADGITGVTFTFDANVLGALPTSAGLVWTDGANSEVFEAFDQNGNSLGTITGNSADNTFFGTTGEDRFYGVSNASGISKIFIHSGDGGIEVDHLQYGFSKPNGSVPEPSSLVMLGSMGLAAFGFAFRKRSK